MANPRWRQTDFYTSRYRLKEMQCRATREIQPFELQNVITRPILGMLHRLLAQFASLGRNSGDPVLYLVLRVHLLVR